MADYTVAHDGLNALLQSLPENTAKTAYSIELSSVTAEFLVWNAPDGIRTALKGNPLKYVGLTFGIDCQSIFANLTDMFALFQACSSLVFIELPPTPNVINVNSLFYSCTSLVSAKLSFMPRVTDARKMFKSCCVLTEIRGWDVPIIAADSTEMFIDCNKLKAVYVNSVSDTESWRSFAVSHGSGGDDTVTVYGSDGSTEATATVPNTEGRSVEATDWVDELILSDAEIPGAKVADMMATRLPVTGDMNAADPSEDTFTLWVKNGDRKRVNMKLSDFTNDLKLSDFTNDMSLSDFTNDLLIPVGRPANVQVGSIWLG